jgi:hypothetical protein
MGARKASCIHYPHFCSYSILFFNGKLKVFEENFWDKSKFDFSPSPPTEKKITFNPYPDLSLYE